MRHSIALSTLFSLTLANTTLPFFFIGGVDIEVTNPVASVVSADNGTTLLALGCPKSAKSAKSADLDYCGWGTGDFTVSIISTSVYAFNFSDKDFNYKCTSTKDAMNCSIRMPLEIGDITTTQTQMTLSGKSAAMQTATVTAGEEKLQASATSASMTSSASAGAKGSAAAATSSGAKPASSSNAAVATRFGVEGAAFAAMVGVAALL
jgi:hypothetical protein